MNAIIARVFPALEIAVRSNDAMSKHTLYYSTRCRFCQAFLEELSSTPYVPEFRLVCVDPSQARPALPSWLKSVPSLLVLGETTPRVGPGPVNNWLFERKLGASGTTKNASQLMEERNAPVVAHVYNPEMAPRPDATARTPTPARMPAAISGATKADSSMSPPSAGSGGAGADGGPMAYHGSEMGASKWSDDYSFLGSEFNSQQGYNPIGRNFESLIPESTFANGGKSAQAPAPKRSAKEDALSREYEAFTAARDRDVAGPIMRRQIRSKTIPDKDQIEMTTAIGGFNNQLLSFVEELSDTYPEEKDLSTAVDAIKALKKANPKLLHSAFMEYIYPDFHGPVMEEDEVTLMNKGREVLSSEYKDYAFAYVIFDRHWNTMSEANKKSIWDYCKVLCILAERAAGLRQ